MLILDKAVTVEALTMAGTQQSYTTHPLYPGQVFVNIQPAGAEFNDMSEGMFYKIYKVFTTASGIAETDRITEVATGKKYVVRGRENYSGLLAPHYELVAESVTR